MLQEAKYYFDNLFATKWTKTPIHFAGQEFDHTQLADPTTWVNPSFSPISLRDNGIGIGSMRIKGMVYIPCWAKNDVLAMQLADDIISFCQTEIDPKLFNARKFDIIDHGWDSSNLVFIVVGLEVEQVVGSCLEPVTYILDGTDIIVDGTDKIID